MAVEAKKTLRGDESRALVAVDEWMVPGDSESIAGCQPSKRNFVRVSEDIFRLRQSRIEQPLVSNAVRPSVFRELTRVRQQDFTLFNPDWLSHARYSASFLSTSRFSRITCSSISIFAAREGS